MTRREILMAQYEDARFALLMDAVAESQGQKAIEENRRLRDSGELEVPASVHQRCRRAIAKRTAERDLKRFGRGFSRVLTRIAVVALVGLLLFTTAFAASEDFRLKTLNLLIETFDDRIKLTLVSDNALSENQTGGAPEITVGWLPEGFALTAEETTDFSAWKEYSTPASDAMLAVYVVDLSTGGSNFDTEATEKVSTTIQGTDAFYITDGSVVQVVWGYDAPSQWVYYVTGTHTDVETVLKVAENVTA